MEIIGVILRLLVVSVVSVVLSVLAMQVVKWTGTDLKDFKQRTRPKVLAIAAIFNLLFILVVALIMRFWDHQSIKKLGFTFNTSGFIFSLVVLLLSVGFALLYVGFLHARKVLKISRATGFFKNPVNLVNIIFGFLVLFIAALQEEIMFRGYFAFVLLPYGFWYALFISSIIFTLWHFLTNKTGFFQSVDWFLGGIMLFYIYWISGSIWIATLTHFSRNFTNVLVFNISGSEIIVSYEKPIGSSHKTVYTIFYSLLIMLFGYIYFVHV